MIVAYALKRIGEFDIRKPGGHVEHIAEDVVYVAAIAPCTVAISTATKHFFMKFLSTTLLMVIRVDIIQKSCRECKLELRGLIHRPQYR